MAIPAMPGEIPPDRARTEAMNVAVAPMISYLNSNHRDLEKERERERVSVRNEKGRLRLRKQKTTLLHQAAKVELPQSEMLISLLPSHLLAASEYTHDIHIYQ